MHIITGVNTFWLHEMTSGDSPPGQEEACLNKRRGLLTQLVRRSDNVGRNTRVQISVHDAQRVQLGHMVPSDLQEVTTAQTHTREGGGGGVGSVE